MHYIFTSNVPAIWLMSLIFTYQHTAFFIIEYHPNHLNFFPFGFYNVFLYWPTVPTEYHLLNVTVLNVLQISHNTPNEILSLWGQQLYIGTGPHFNSPSFPYSCSKCKHSILFCQNIGIWFYYSHPTLLAGVSFQDTSTKSKNLWIIYCPPRTMFWYILVFLFPETLWLFEYHAIWLQHMYESSDNFYAPVHWRVQTYLCSWICETAKYKPTNSDGWVCVVVCAWCWAFYSDLSRTSHRTYQYFITMPISFLLSQHIPYREHNNNGNHG